MKKRGMWLLALLLVASPVWAQKVFIDYDKDYDLSSIKTFAWTDTEETSLEKSHPLYHSRIVNGIEYYMTRGGAAQVEQDPDVYVTYHGSSETGVSVNVSRYAVVYPTGWWHGGYYSYFGYPSVAVGVGTTSNMDVYKHGTLVVDVWDARTNALVWRGIATEVDVTEEAKVMVKRLDKALAKMVKKWQKIKKQQ